MLFSLPCPPGTARVPCALRARRPRSQKSLALFWSNDRAAVLEFDLHRLVRAAFRAAVQRIDRHGDLIAWLQALRGHPVPDLQARRAALKDPILGGAVLALD